MRFLLVFSILLSILYANEQKIYYYTIENHIDNFKNLKISFDDYLKDLGDYEFQAFSDKTTFEDHIKGENIIILLSSWHYKQIAKEYNLKPHLIAQRNNSITDTKILIGKKNSKINGTIATAYSKEYANLSLQKIIPTNKVNIITVPKELDALMSVGFGMSDFAYVSKDSFELLKNININLAKNLKIYSESTPYYRMLIATYKNDKTNKDIESLFSNMDKTDEGKKILELFGIDNIVLLKPNDIKTLNKEGK